jgi:hypothetical protein
MEQQIPLGVTPVQVVDSLPPMPAIAKPARVVRKPNPTGLSRAEIRLLADAVAEAAAWRGHQSPEDHPAFDAHIAKMKAALRKLRAAAGVR